jgi:hypothetical protein
VLSQLDHVPVRIADEKTHPRSKPDWPLGNWDAERTEFGNGLVDRGDTKCDMRVAGMPGRHVHEDVLARGRLIAIHNKVDFDALSVRNDDHLASSAEGDIESELLVERERARLVRYPNADVVDLLNLKHGRKL